MVVLLGPAIRYTVDELKSHRGPERNSLHREVTDLRDDAKVL